MTSAASAETAPELEASVAIAPERTPDPFDAAAGAYSWAHGGAWGVWTSVEGEVQWFGLEEYGDKAFDATSWETFAPHADAAEEAVDTVVQELGRYPDCPPVYLKPVHLAHECLFPLPLVEPDLSDAIQERVDDIVSHITPQALELELTSR